MRRLSILSWEGARPSVRHRRTLSSTTKPSSSTKAGASTIASPCALRQRLHRQAPTSTKAVVKKPAVDNIDGRLTD